MHTGRWLGLNFLNLEVFLEKGPLIPPVPPLPPQSPLMLAWHGTRNPSCLLPALTDSNSTLPKFPKLGLTKADGLFTVVMGRKRI